MNTLLKVYAMRGLWLLVLVELVLQAEAFLRGPVAAPISDPKADVRILCIGESITDGYTRALKTRLDKEYPGRKFQVTQLVKSAGRSDEIVDLLERYGLDLRPHIVIAMMGLNDDSGKRKLPQLIKEPFKKPSSIGLVRLWQSWRRKSNRLPIPEEAITWRLPEDVAAPERKVIPTDPWARQLRESLALAIDGDRSAALAKLEPVLKRPLEAKTPWNELAAIYSHLQMIPEAKEQLAYGLQQRKSGFSELNDYYSAAESALRIHEPDLALSFITRIKQDGVTDDDSKTLLVRSRVAREKGQYDEALRHLAKIQLPERNGIMLQANLEHATLLAFQGGGLLNPLWSRAEMPENFYTDLTKESYHRLTQLAYQYDFKVVAMQYPLKPLSFLRETVGSDPIVSFVDNEPSFRTALKKLGYTNLFLDIHYSGRVGHLNWTSQQILVDNIMTTLHPILSPVTG